MRNKSATRSRYCGKYNVSTACGIVRWLCGYLIYKREKDRRERDDAGRKRETANLALKELNDEHAQGAIEFVLEHGAIMLYRVTNNTRLRSFKYKIHACIIIYTLRTRSTKQGKCGEVVKRGGKRREEFIQWTELMNWWKGEFLRCGWMVGRSS